MPNPLIFHELYEELIHTALIAPNDEVRQKKVRALFERIWADGQTRGLAEALEHDKTPSTNPFRPPLPFGRYFDGTYEWDYDELGWTPLRAPSGMPSEPRFEQLQKVERSYRPLTDLLDD